MVKKLTAICIGTIFLLLLLPFAVSAEQAEILSPENGAVVSVSFSEISAALPPETDKAVLYIDGERIFETGETQLSYSLENPFSIGKHEVAVVTISESGVGKTVSQFEVKAPMIKEHLNLNMNDAPDLADFSEIVKAVTGTDGESYNIQFKGVDGREGDGDSAAAFCCPVDTPETDAKIQPSYSSTGSAWGFPWTGKLDIQMDMYFSRATAIEFETKNTSGEFGFLFAQTLFTKEGKIAETGGKNYPIGEWFRMRAIIDTETLLGCSLDIGTYEEDGTLSWERVISDFTHNAKIRNTNIFKIQPNFGKGYSAQAGQIFAIDNLVISEEKTISANVPVGYISSGEFVEAEENILPHGIDTIKLDVGKNFALCDVKDKVTVLVNRTNIPILSAVIDERGLLIKLSKSLPKGAKGKILLSSDITLETGGNLAADASVDFTTSYEGSAVAGVSFEVNSKPLCSVAQLSAGDLIEATVTHPAVYEETYRVYFLGVYDGTKLIGIDCIQTDISLVPETTLSVTLPADFNISDKTEVKLFSVNSLTGRMPSSEIYSVK